MSGKRLVGPVGFFFVTVAIVTQGASAQERSRPPATTQSTEKKIDRQPSQDVSAGDAKKGSTPRGQAKSSQRSAQERSSPSAGKPRPSLKAKPAPTKRPELSVETTTLQLAAGKSLRHTLSSPLPDEIVAIVATGASKTTDEVSISLESSDRTRRLLTIRASAKAAGQYELVGVQRDRGTTRLAVRLLVTPAPASAGPGETAAPQRRPAKPTRDEPQPAPSPTVSLKVAAGDAAQATVSGDVFSDLRGLRILRNRQVVRDVEASLAKTPRGFVVAVKANREAAAGDDYMLVGIDASGRMVRLPLTLQVTSASPSLRPTSRRDEDRPGSGRPGFGDEKTAAALPALIRMQPGSSTSLPLNAAAYEGVTGTRAMERGEVSDAVRAEIVGSGNDRKLVLAASPNASASDLQVLGLGDNRSVMRLTRVLVTSTPGDTAAPPAAGPRAPRDESSSRLAVINLKKGRTTLHSLTPEQTSRIETVRVLKGNQPTDDIAVAFGQAASSGIVKLLAEPAADAGSQYQLQGMNDGQAVVRLATIRVIGQPADDGDASADSGSPDTQPGGGAGGQDAEDFYSESLVRLVLESQTYQAPVGTTDVPVQIQRNGYTGSLYLVCFHNEFPLLPPSQTQQVKALFEPMADPDNGAPYANNQATVRVTVQAGTPAGTMRQFRVQGLTTTGQTKSIPPTEFSVQVAASESPSPPDPVDTTTPDPGTAPSDTGQVQVANGLYSPLSPGASYLSGSQVGAFYDANGDGLIASVGNASNSHVYPRHAVASGQSAQLFTLVAGRAFHPGSDILVEAHLNWSSVNRPQYAALYLKRQGNSLVAKQMWAGDLLNAAPIPGTTSTVQGVVMNSSDGPINLQIETFQMPTNNSAGHLKGVGTANVYFISPGGSDIYNATVSFAFDCPILPD